MAVAKVIVEILLFWVVVVAVLVSLWRFARRYRLTTLVCPHCGGKTPLAQSKPDIRCRACRAPLQLKGRLEENVVMETFRLFERSRNTS